VPILTMCALAGLVEWHEVPRLPFELACLPQSWYRFARLPVVSYALPALIAIGQCIHYFRGTWNPITGFLRLLGKKRSLRVLERIQPSSGGYLEATPLTSFVVMSLAAVQEGEKGRGGEGEKGRRGEGETSPAQRVIGKGIEFIVNSMRPDGSWPIDTNLSIWVTTLSINALAAADDLDAIPDSETTFRWLLAQQVKELHPYTGADPGGWGWSHSPGSVPDCDDTPGALLALLSCVSPPLLPIGEHEHPLHAFDDSFRIPSWYKDAVQPVIAARQWVQGLQNRDGGWPTFCRGWGQLPFDRSGADLTAHALRALALAQPRGLQYLERQQRLDGSWLPLWFGNQHAPDDINPTYGTAKVLAAYRDLNLLDSPEAQKGIAFLLSIQNADGGWGGAMDTPSSVEETALVVEILCDRRLRLSGDTAKPQAPVERGIDYLLKRVEDGTFTDASPIGFYFAKLWYFEKLYPIIFTVAALGRALRTSVGET
jgi:squalene-hopene/tetraprenyl-beta-curcumene cyclase